MKRTGIFIPTALALAACAGHLDSTDTTGTSQSAIQAAVPKAEWFKIELAPPANALSIEQVKQQLKLPQCVGGPPAQFAVLSGTIMSGSNGVIEGILQTVASITQSPPLMQGPGHAVWGPLTSQNDPIVRKLEIDQVGPDTFHFVLSGRPKPGDESTWRGLFQGVVHTAGPMNDGDASVDFGAIHSLDPSSDPVTGGVSIHFAGGPGQRVIDETFSGIAGKMAPQPNDAHYHFDQAPTGVHFDFVTRTDFDHDGTLDERLEVQSRWVAPGAGKASVVVTGGSLGQKSVGAIECWDPAKRVVFYADDVNANSPAGNPACCIP